MAWRPSRFLRWAIALHPLAAATYLFVPASGPGLLTGLLSLHAGIALIGLWPRSTLLGDNLVRLPARAVARREVALTFDDGPDPLVTPQVLAILRQYQARATFFCIGSRAQACPALCRQIVAEGHEIENHGQRHHPLTPASGLAGWRREIGEAQQTLSRITGRPPAFYRPMAGLRNPLLDPVLQQSGLRLACWTRRGFDTRVKDPEQVYAKLARDLSAGAILLLHDGNAATGPRGRPVVLDVLPRLLDDVAARQLVTVTLQQACKTD